jgi:hypothetical protein
MEQLPVSYALPWQNIEISEAACASCILMDAVYVLFVQPEWRVPSIFVHCVQCALAQPMLYSVQVWV